ncbi:MAG TPA: polysaccharide deacetylase family protein [Terriglobales bacterium]|nr:polysaccharide deacetylase family protein [Terriglobales bacterium]
MSSVEIMPVTDRILSEGAMTYAVRQLARRAGVTAEQFREWRIEHQLGQTTIFPFPGNPQRVVFPHAPDDYWQRIRSGNFSVQRVGWPHGSLAQQRAAVDFVIPFADRAPAELFTFSHGGAECSVDLLASVALTLSRYEETLPGRRDRHGRFPAEAGLAVQHGFALRPVVDEYGLALQSVLEHLLPGWQPEPRQLQVNLTHDVDEIGIPFRARLAARRTVRGGAAAAVREVLAGFGSRPTALSAVLETVRMAQSRNLRSSVYWKASPAGEFDSGYDVRDRRVEQVIQNLAESGAELGVHPGYDTYANRELLGEEIGRLRKALGGSQLGGRQHFLRWSPQTWLDWEACGLAYDSSVGYSECLGFRAGTCYPYRPWLLEQDREADLLEVPLIAMDCTLTGPMGLPGEQCLEPLRKCAAACESVGGVFTLLWHTDSILEPVYGDTYNRILDLLAGRTNFRWQQDLAEGYA